MKKLFRKKGDALSGVILAIVFIIIVLLTIPAFRGIQNDNTSAASAISRTNINFINEGLEDAGEAPGYNLDTEQWGITDATSVGGN